MREEIIEKAVSIIKAKQTKAELLAKGNLQKALENKQFADVFEKEQSAIIELAKKEADGEKIDKGILYNLKKDKEIILQLMGMTTSEINPKYQCSLCQDNGYVENKMCGCLKKIISKMLFEESGFEKIKSFSEANYKLFDEPEKVKQLYTKMKEWCNKDSSIKTILLCGNSGSGKTFLTQCMANELITNGKLVLFASAFSLNEDLRKYHTTFDEDKEKYITKYLESDILFIDDLGTEPVFKNVTMEYLYLIINERMIKNKSVVITTNLRLNELRDRYGERIFSRIINKEKSICLEVNNPDLRLKSSR